MKGLLCPHSLSFLRFYLYIFRERGREGEGGGENIYQLPLTCPLLGTWPATQASTLTGNRTGDRLVHRLVLNPLSHTSQGFPYSLITVVLIANIFPMEKDI